MKIAIVNDNPETLKGMMKVLKARGHTVLGILCRNVAPPLDAFVELWVNGVTKRLWSFDPDYVLIDHFLQLVGEANGASVVRKSNISRDKFIGTEVSIEFGQPYCADSFHSVEGIQDDPELREMFIKMFEWS